MRRALLAVASAILLYIPARSGADTIVLEDGVNSYSGTSDNSIFQNRTNNTGGSFEYLFAGVTQDASPRRALIRFDLSGIPAGATITSASLRLSVERSRPGIQPYSLHRLTASWGEGATTTTDPGGLGEPASTGDATWTARHFATSDWITSGGDYLSTASAAAMVDVAPSTATLTGAGLIADIQGMVNGSATNHGWILIGNEAGVHNAKRFYSREGLAGMRPRLTVDYTPAPARVEDALEYSRPPLSGR